MNDIAVIDPTVQTAVDNVQRSVADLISSCPLVIRTPADREAGSVARRAIKQRENAIEQERKALVGPLNNTVKRINDLFRTPLEALRMADNRQEHMLLAWDREQERLRLDEQRRLQAIERERVERERMKAEQEAAKQREIQRQAEEKAAEARRQAEEANAAERKRLLAQAEAAERKAAAAAVKVEEKQEQAASVVEHVVTVSGPEKQAGESTRKRWKAKLTDKQALIAVAAVNDVAASLLTFDQSAADRLATATKGAINISGIEWYTENILAVRGGKE